MGEHYSPSARTPRVSRCLPGSRSTSAPLQSHRTSSSTSIISNDWADKRGEQAVEFGGGVVGEAGVDGAGLDDGAAGGGQPAEPAADVLLARRPGAGDALAD